MSGFMKQLNKNMFVILLTAGIALSYLVRIYYEESLGGVTTSSIAIGICLFCLALYGVIVWLSDVRLHNPDNLYYMGLLFTLSSLVYSLITLFLLSSEEVVPNRVYNLIGSFGIALISTFAGILFRILLLQRLDAIDFAPLDESDGQREAASRSLSIDPQAKIETNAAMLRQMEASAQNQTRKLVTLSSTMVEKLSEMVDEIGMSVENIHRPLDELARRVQHSVNMAGRSAEKMEQNIQDSSAKIIGEGEKVEEAVGAIQEPLRGIVSDLQATNETTHKLTSQYDSLYASLQQSTTFFSRIEGEIEKATATLSEATQAFSKSLVEKLNAATSAISESIESTRQPLDDLATEQTKLVRHSVVLVEQSTDQLERGIQDSSLRIANGGEKIEAAVGAILDPLQSIAHDLQVASRNAQALSSQYDSMNSSLHQSTALFTNIGEEINQATKALSETTKAFSGSLSEATEITPQYTQQFAQLISALRQEAEKWQGMTREVRSSLVQAIEELSQAVKRN